MYQFTFHVVEASDFQLSLQGRIEVKLSPGEQKIQPLNTSSILFIMHVRSSKLKIINLRAHLYHIIIEI